jgi:hypothetical protein
MKILNIYLLIIFILFFSISSEDLEFTKENISKDELSSEDSLENDSEELGPKAIIRELGFDKEEFLTHKEMRIIYKKIFINRELSEEEKNQFGDMIDNILKEVPHKIDTNDILKYFDIPFLMKFMNPDDNNQEK